MAKQDLLRQGCIYSVDQPELWLHPDENMPGCYRLRDGLKNAVVFHKGIAEKTIQHHQGSKLAFMSLLTINQKRRQEKEKAKQDQKEKPNGGLKWDDPRGW